MTVLIRTLVIGAALLFIAVSAGMNALFLSSLGRTLLETTMLGAVSVASDAAKVALPVLVMRALAIRAWVHAGAACLMLIAVIGLSLASGTGFAVSTRSSKIGEREAHAARISAIQRQLENLDQRIGALASSRPEAVPEIELAGLQINRQWALSRECSSPNSQAGRSFCADVFRLRTELETAKARTALASEQRALVATVEELQRAGGVGDSDPQAAAIADLFGLDRHLPGVIAASWMAIIAELGSVIMILLAAGPTIHGWREPGMIEPSPLVPAELPVEPARHYWRRQRSAMSFGATSNRVEGHDGGR